MKKLRWIIMVLLASFFVQGAMSMEVRAQEGSTNADNKEAMLLTSTDVNSMGQANGHILLSDLLTTLEQHFDVTFLYKDEVVMDKYVNPIKIGEETGQKLSFILDRLGLAFQQIDEQTYVLLRKKPSSQTASVQEEISGTVTDAQTGETLPGVNVIVKGTTTGTSTGSEGTFELTVESLQDTLVFSFVGYQTQEVPVNGQTEINVALQSQAIAGEELVVVGYGTQEREDLTGSVSSISGEDVESVSITTPDQALDGKISGVQVQTNSHSPGGSISVQVRGTSSLSASSQPLYVVDGYPISNNAVVGLQTVKQSAPAGNPLNTLDPSNIKSIDVLKDASATAIYGSRGSNGVVLITTKRGRSSETNIKFSSSVGIQQAAKKFELLGAREWAEIKNRQAELNDENPLFTNEEIAGMGAGTDWQSEIFQSDAITQNYKLSFSGGTNQLRYFLSGGLKDQEGVIEGSGFDRYNVRLNLDGQISSKFKVGASLNGTSTKRTAVPTNTKGYGSYPTIIRQIVGAAPTIPVKVDGEYTDFSNYKGGGGENPMVTAKEYDHNEYGRRFLGTLFGEYSFADNLYLKVNLGANIYDFDMGTYFPIGSEASGGREGVGSILNNQTTSFLNENTLHYKTSIRDNHEINALAGFTFQRQYYRSSSSSAWGFPSDAYSYNNLGLASAPQAPISYASEWTLMSYLTRLNYNYKKKYLITGTLRADGSSKFGDNNKYGIFPSGAFAWRLSQEPLFQEIEAIDELKLRLSYGITGNDKIGEYNSLATIQTSRDINSAGRAYALAGQVVPVAAPANFKNSDLSWEKSKEFNVGIDLGLWANRLNISVNYYNRKTTDLLLSVPLPTQSGYKSILKNAGSLRNKGWEFEMNSYNIVSSDFNWTSNFNISFNRNEVLDLGGASELFVGWAGGGNVDAHGSNVARLAPGEAVGKFYGAVYEGIWNSQEEIDQAGTMPGAEPGDFRFKDTNGDGTYDTNDHQYVGDPNPDFTFGLSNNFSYKQLGLYVSVNGSYGNDIVNFNNESLFGSGTWVKNRDRWTPENPNSNVLGLASGWDDVVSTYSVEDASYLRVKNIRLSFTFQEVASLKNLKMYVAANNFFTITGYNGLDPETNSYGYSNVARGIDQGAYPPVRSLVLGVDLNF